MHTFTPNTTIESAKVNVNFSGLADGSEIGNGAITDDKWRNSVAFRAYRNAAKTIGASFADIAHDTEVFDIGSNFDPTTGLFTVPYNGIYCFEATLNTGSATVRSLVNLVASTSGTFNASDYETTRTRRAGHTFIVSLVASETVKVQGFTNTSQDVASTGTVFAGFMVTRTS